MVSLPRETAVCWGGAPGARQQACSGHQSPTARAQLCGSYRPLETFSSDQFSCPQVLQKSWEGSVKGGQMQLPEATGQDTSHGEISASGQLGGTQSHCVNPVGSRLYLLEWHL